MERGATGLIILELPKPELKTPGTALDVHGSFDYATVTNSFVYH